MVTETSQDYLKTIYKLAEKSKTVTTNAIAERIGVAQASVTAMIKKLAELKLIHHTPYHGVELTQAGEKIALEIIRHHRLLELYLAEALGYSWDRVHDEAEKLEHVISEELEDKIAEFLENPSRDPHGASIPTKDGAIEERALIPLTSAEAGQTVKIERVGDNKPEMLRYLSDIGIYPKVIIDVIEKAPFGGPLLIKVGKKKHYLGEELTNNIFFSQKFEQE